MKSKKTMRRILLVAGVIALIATIALLPKTNGSNGGAHGARAAASETTTVYSVTTQVLTKTDLQEYLTMNGNVQTNNTISVYP